MVYDPQKAHDYYERTKNNKGRAGGSKTPSTGPRPSSSKTPSSDPKKSHQSPTVARTRAIARVGRLKTKTAQLQGALTEAQQALTAKRLSAAKDKKESSDGKSTAKEKQASQEYRDKHPDKAKSSSSKSSKGSSSSSTSTSEMGVDDLEARVSRIKTALGVARQQLSTAQQVLGQLAHSDMTDRGILSHELALQPTISRKDSVSMDDVDFSGYATRTNLKCKDGRVILTDAFKNDDGQFVPLVWQHGHDMPTNILGRVKLENRPEGTYAWASFNNTPDGQHAKEAVRHGDVRFLSIFANSIVERAKEVVHGSIKEVSLVIAGANPGAFIDNVNIAHGDGEFQSVSDEVYITTGIEVEIAHADTAVVDEPKAKSVEEILETLNDEQETAVNYLLARALVGEGADADAVKHSDEDADASVDTDADADKDADTSVDTDADAASDEAADKDADASVDTDADATETPADDNQTADEDADASAEATSDEDADKDAEAAADADEDAAASTDEAGDAVQHNHTQEDDSMTHNLFDSSNLSAASDDKRQTLAHADVSGIMQSGVNRGSGTLSGMLKEYAIEHGIENIDYLFPNAQLLDASPNFVSRRMEWVTKVLAGVRKTPFARIKSVSADITEDEARAKGYIKGNLKAEEFFELIKRETTPQTIYKKQKLDRDDVLDITDLDVIAWVKAEMKIMLDEELAGAFLIGDGRSNGDPDKIKEDKIRPIATDSELYVTTANVNIDDASSSIEELVDAVISNRQYYKGTGTPSFYTSEMVVAAFLNVKDGFGHRLYKSLDEVATVLRVQEIVPVDVMDRAPSILGIMVNLSDYSLGTDRGGQATMFDDFDLDYNKLRYLLETRLCGALTLPKSAVVFKKMVGTDTLLADPTAPSRTGNVVTVPTVANVTYKDGAGTTLTTGSPVTVVQGTELNITATPAAGKYFANSARDQWSYDYKA